MTPIECERYDIDPTPIGKGGFGEAYFARDLLYDRRVVIKTIVASRLYGIDEQRIRQNFFREAMVSARLGQQSENIVKVLDFGYDKYSDVPFFVMEFVDGGDLSSLVGTMSMKAAFHLFANLVDALSVAHRNGVIHSDISPDNILHDEKSRAYKLNDFGLSKLLNSILLSRKASLSLTGGKPGYLPFEQMHSGERNEFTDLYGLAVTIVNLIKGVVPMSHFDFRKREIVPPDVASLLMPIDASNVLMEGEDNPQFSVRSTFDDGRWQHVRPYGVREWAEVTEEDFVAVLLGIFDRRLLALNDVLDELRLRAKDRLDEREAVKRSVDAAIERKKAERRAEEKRKKEEEEEEAKRNQVEPLTPKENVPPVSTQLGVESGNTSN